MEVYTFEKSYLERLKEAEAVLSWDGDVMPASQVRSEWKSFVELRIEPAGWQAIWKIPRVICEDLKLRYPTIVYGYVDQVIFDELKAVFVVTAVQDNDVHLPESNEVSLVELWPTVKQENDALNVDTTAECIDRLRFFYSHVWMPWDKDYDDDRDWVQMHLQARIQLACDLSKNKLSRPLALHMRTLLMEAMYIQQRLEYLELDLSDAEVESDDEAVELNDNAAEPARKQPKTGGSANGSLNVSALPVTDLMCLHLRMAIIRSEFEILENPEMRRAYSELQSNSLKRQLLQLSAGRPSELPLTERTPICHVVTVPGTLQQQMDLLTLAKEQVQPDRQVQLANTLQDVLSICRSDDDILLSPGEHTIKFLEHLNDNGSLKGLVKSEAILVAQPQLPQLPVVCSSDEGSTLLVIDGDYTLSRLVLDCRHVRRGILLRNGTLTVHGCRLLGDGNSSTQEGIVCMPNASVEMRSCVIENFAVGISLRPQSSAELGNVQVKNCNTGVELLDTTVALNLQGSKCSFDGCKVGIMADKLALPDKDDKALILKQYSELKRYNDSLWLGNCNFVDCTRNVRVFNESDQLLAQRSQQRLLEEELEGENKENIETA
ncbi:LOW QUALITY PROTEIN: protein nessun dorma [Drosophila obscura]|uniref:LOW QUALITY PROTEIN: protein nessun dorma n=1 Tax=Drosophila obscura TaxID=7282 RepID=UPI001BB24B94|nr:LOW QUALITY PROTEIN: protein nessun dorma [Drosophila obscura]